MKQAERVARTKAALIDAFWKLYKSKPIDQISVREITDAAGVYRSTFYLYFKDANTVLAMLEDELLERLAALLGGVEGKSSFADLPAIFALFYKKEGSYLHPLLGPEGDHAFAERVLGLIRPTLDEASELDAQAFDMSLRFYCSAIIGLFGAYYTRRRKVSLESVAELAAGLIAGATVPAASGVVPSADKPATSEQAPAATPIETAEVTEDKPKKKASKPKAKAKPAPKPEPAPVVPEEDEDIQMALF